MNKLAKLHKDLVKFSVATARAADRSQRGQGPSLSGYYAGRSEAYGEAASWLRQELVEAGADFERGLKVVESEATDDLVELDLALRGLEWAVVNLRESLLDVVVGLVRNLQKGDEADEQAEARSP